MFYVFFGSFESKVFFFFFVFNMFFFFADGFLSLVLVRALVIVKSFLWFFAFV